MASPRSTPFIASWDTEDALDATAPLDELVAARPSPAPAARAFEGAPSVGGPSRLAWCGIGLTGALAAGALLWATAAARPPVPTLESPTRVPPPPVRAELLLIAERVEMTPPSVVFAPIESPVPSPRPQATRRSAPIAQPRSELATALLERRRQLSQTAAAAVQVDAVADIRFDPSRRSARVVYRAANSAAEVVEYWAVRDGRWQALD